MDIIGLNNEKMNKKLKKKKLLLKRAAPGIALVIIYRYFYMFKMPIFKEKCLFISLKTIFQQ
jgi:hypothetical protein